MRRILYTLLFLPICSQAQQWKIGLNVGASAVTELKEFTSSTEIHPGGALMITVSRSINPRLEIGIQSLATTIVRGSHNITAYDSFGTPLGTYINAQIHIGKPAFLITPFLSWHIRNSYLGIQGGLFTTLPGNDNISDKVARFYFNRFRGFTLGIHVGHEWHITNMLLINAELRANYIKARMKENGVVGYGLHTYQGAITIGAKYTIGRKKITEGNKAGV